MIAREIADRVHRATRLVDRMNERLAAVRTAHDVGVRLRWQRSRELDPSTAAMIDLLTKLPDLRTEDDESRLRRALSDHLEEARALQPDVPYRQLIAETLDYKRWHEMAVMVRRPGDKETRLSRRTPLSEGEKKLVTYLPLFAAVAASCDSIAEQADGIEDEGRGVARFVVLDDAFAKVSEDNHARLFGLLVDLDLDLIATSERLWGTHATVPELRSLRSCATPDSAPSCSSTTGGTAPRSSGATRHDLRVHGLDLRLPAMNADPAGHVGAEPVLRECADADGPDRARLLFRYLGRARMARLPDDPRRVRGHLLR